LPRGGQFSTAVDTIEAFHDLSGLFNYPVYKEHARTCSLLRSTWGSRRATPNGRNGVANTRGTGERNGE